MALDPDLRKILQTNMHAIATSVQLQHLLPFLRKSDLITDPEFENLSASARESNYDRNQRMVSIILQKGKDAFDLFVTALQSEKLHIGHKSLAETLQAAKKEYKKPRPPSRTMFFTPPCPRTNRFTQHTPALLAQVKPRRRRKSTGGDRQISESQAEHQMSKEISQQFEEPKDKVEVTVRTSRSELPKLFGSTVNPNKKMENRITILETDVKVIKENSEEMKKNTKETMKMLQTLTAQFNRAFETLSDQMEKVVSSQSYEVDIHDVNQEITVSESQQELRREVTDNDYIEEGDYMVPPNVVNKDATAALHNKQPHPQHHDYVNIPPHVHKQCKSDHTYTPLLHENRDDEREYTHLQEGHYSFIKLLAEGTTGNFWLAGKHENRVAVKVANTKEIVTQEMKALKRLSDRPNIVKVVNVKLEHLKAPSLTLTFEYAVNNNLHRYLKNKKSEFGDQQLLEIAIYVANGMKQLERCNVIHCDLRAHNILVDGDVICKVASFNKALCLEHDETHRTCQNQPVAIRWQPPEVLGNKTFSIKSDVWSFGVLLFEVFSFSSNPYPDMSKEQVRSYVMSGKKMPKPKDCPEEIYQIMRSCFEFDATKRPSFCYLHQQLQNIQAKKYSTEPEFD